MATTKKLNGTVRTVTFIVGLITAFVVGVSYIDGRLEALGRSTLQKGRAEFYPRSAGDALYGKIMCVSTQLSDLLKASSELSADLKAIRARIEAIHTELEKLKTRLNAGK